MSAYADAVLATAGLVHYWKLTDATDSKGSDHLNSIGPQVWRMEPGRTIGEYAMMFTNQSNAFYFPSSNAYLDSYAVVNAPTPLSGAHSVEMLVKPRRAPVSSNYIISSRSASDEVWSPTHFWIAPDYSLTVVYSDTTLGQNTLPLGAAKLILPGWHHVVGTINSARQWEVFIDGTSEATGTMTDFSGTPVMFAAGHSLTLGRMVAASSDAGNGSASFDGALQHLAVYNVKLSSATVASHYSALGTVPAPSTNRKVWTPMGIRLARTYRTPSPVPRLARTVNLPATDMRTLFANTVRPGRNAAAPPAGYGVPPETIIPPGVGTGVGAATRPNTGQVWPRN